MKVFVSVPMRGYTDEEIEKNISRMIEIAKVLLKDKGRAVFVDSFHLTNDQLINAAKNVKHENLYYLGRALQLMADCDAVIVPEYTWPYRGCNTECVAAYNYKFDVYLIPNNYLYLHNDDEEDEVYTTQRVNA